MEKWGWVGKIVSSNSTQNEKKYDRNFERNEWQLSWKNMTAKLVAPLKLTVDPIQNTFPFPRRPCWKGYVRVNKTQLKKHSGKLQFHPLVCHTLPASLTILDFNPIGEWHESPFPVILDMPTAMIICQYCSNLCFSLMCPLSHSCCVISLRLKVDGLGNQSSQMRRHIL